MKIAVVYNRDTKNVINLFGVPNRETIAQRSIKRITDALKSGGHQVITLEGDKDLISRLEEFMPRVLKGERPGMVFNISYGIQGQARYTHVPSILEMVGIPYVGSGPLAHSLALDKVVAKMLFRQHGLPTPDFAVLESREFSAPDLAYPLIVKPKNEAVSFGLRVVESEQELREAAQMIFEKYEQAVLVERYIAGREINVGILGNNPAETFPPAEIVFGEGGPPIYSYEDKTGRSGREIGVVCPASVPDDLAKQAQDVALRAFRALGCYDCARVDMRLDDEGHLFILEINSLPSLGEHGSYPAAAQQVGLDFPMLINRLVEVASARYFGTPTPPRIDNRSADPETLIFSFLTQRRDQIERRVREWVSLHSRTSDPVGLQAAVKELGERLEDVGLKPCAEFTDGQSAWAWSTDRGFTNGVLLIGHLDIPLEADSPPQAFRRDPEWLYGEGIAASKGSLAMVEFALRSLKVQRRLRDLPLGVLVYTDEGRDYRYSSKTTRGAVAQARDVLVLRPGSAPDRVVTQRRGQRKYRLTVEGKSTRSGQARKSPDALLWVAEKLGAISRINSKKDRLAVSAVDVETQAYPLHLPHRVSVMLLLTYLNPNAADAAEERIREILNGKEVRWSLERISDRPPMEERRANEPLLEALKSLAANWDIPLEAESSAWPSVAGLVPPSTAVICGMGPVGRNLYTPEESVQRVSLMQRTLLLAQFLHRYGRR